MSIFNFFYDRWTKVLINDSTTFENIVMTRVGRGNSPAQMNDKKDCLFQDDTIIDNGDILNVVDKDTQYIVIGKEISTDSIGGQLRIVNCKIGIYSVSDAYVGNRLSGKTETLKIDNIPAYYYMVSGNEKYFDAGLLPETVCKFIFKTDLSQNATPITLELNDRIKIKGNNFQVIAIDDIKYPNLYEVQCSEDNRKTNG